MRKESESFLHETGTWIVKKRNGQFEKFNGYKLKKAILKSMKSVECKLAGGIGDFKEEVKMATIVTIQVCAELERAIRIGKVQETEIYTDLIRHFCERELAHQYFEAAKQFIIVGEQLNTNEHQCLDLVCDFSREQLGLSR